VQKKDNRDKIFCITQVRFFQVLLLKYSW